MELYTVFVIVIQLHQDSSTHSDFNILLCFFVLKLILYKDIHKSRSEFSVLQSHVKTGRGTYCRTSVKTRGEDCYENEHSKSDSVEGKTSTVCCFYFFRVLEDHSRAR